MTRWWPLLLTIWIAASFASFREREASELWSNQGIDAQVEFQIASWFAFGLIGAYLVASGRADLRLLRSGPLFWYACFVLLALVSTAWSISPALTLFRGLQLAVALVLVISLREQLARLTTFIVLYVAINWILFLIARLGLDGGAQWLRGPDDLYVAYGGTEFEAWRFWTAFGHPSHISIVAGIAAIGLAARARGRQWLTSAPLIAWLVLTVFLTVSRTAMLATVLGLLIVAAGRRALLPWIAAGSALVFVLLASPDFHDAPTRYLMRGQTTEEFASLTGRTQIYQASLERVEESWLLGQGFQATRKQPLGNLDIVHSHNLVLESIAGLGLPGAALACMVLVSLIGTAWTVTSGAHGRASPADGMSFEPFALLVPIVAFCVMDSGFARSVDPFVMVFLSIATMVQTKSASFAHRSTVSASAPGSGRNPASSELSA